MFPTADLSIHSCNAYSNHMPLNTYKNEQHIQFCAFVGFIYVNVCVCVHVRVRV